MYNHKGKEKNECKKIQKFVAVYDRFVKKLNYGLEYD